jgi:hypothetical protein
MADAVLREIGSTFLRGRAIGIVGAACSQCGSRADSEVVVRHGATLAVQPGTLVEARCTACGHLDEYGPASLRVWSDS